MPIIQLLMLLVIKNIKTKTMKNIIIVISILLINTTVCSAQEPIPPAGTYISHTDINKLTGTWQWVSGTDTVKFRINKENIVIPGQGGEDFLVGYYLYKKAGVIVHNSFQYSSYSYTSGHGTIGQEGYPSGTGLKVVEINLEDSINNRRDHFELTLNSTNDQMVCKRIDAYDKKLNLNLPLLPSYTMPANMVLIKIVPPVVPDN